MTSTTSPVAPSTVDAPSYRWHADGRRRSAPAVFDEFEPFSGALFKAAEIVRRCRDGIAPGQVT